MHPQYLPPQSRGPQSNFQNVPLVSQSTNYPTINQNNGLSPTGQPFNVMQQLPPPPPPPSNSQVPQQLKQNFNNQPMIINKNYNPSGYELNHPPIASHSPQPPPPPIINGTPVFNNANLIGANHMQPPVVSSGPDNLVNQMQNINLSGGLRAPPQQHGILSPEQNFNSQLPPQTQRRMPPGYPPMPSFPPAQQSIASGGSGGGGYTTPYQQPPEQQPMKRLDPDQMPSPIQVTQDDHRNKSGAFVTNQKGLVPPLVSTNFTVKDQGNASPRFIRSSMYSIPISQDLLKQTGVPFSLVISPMARIKSDEYPPPIVNFGNLGPVRCIRCKAYMCPFMMFIDSGRRFQCLFCKATSDVPSEYFQHLNQTGERIDKYQRPELVLGTYEFLATADYCRNNKLPNPPAIIFIIDVSYNNIKSGLVPLLCSQMKNILKNLPIDQDGQQQKSCTKVGFITYNSSVHFYNIKSTLAAPQMMIVSDIQEMFMPLLDGFLCDPIESASIIDMLMEQIPVMFADTKETEIVLLPAIQAGLEALKASDCAGKLLVFQSSLPTADAPGKLKNRDERKLLGTEKERTVLTPQNQAYNQLGQDCVAAGCSVDLFLFNNGYIDLPTISQVSRLTGGDIFKYTYFQAAIDGERIINDLIMDISRPTAFDSVMRVRTSTGVRPTDFYGYFYMSNTTDMEIAAIDCDKAVAIEVKHDDKLAEEDGVYIQAALLYTSCSGQRRLRIINLSLKVTGEMSELYRSCDVDTLMNFISKQATFKLSTNNPKSIKEALVDRTAKILATYRKHCAIPPSGAGQLILPECMKLLPLYTNCLIKCDALSGGADMSIDDRCYAMQLVLMMDIKTSVNYFYPRLIPIHDIDGSIEIPSFIRCTYEKISNDGIYILENGLHMFLWIGSNAPANRLQDLFGFPTTNAINIEQPFLPELDNPYSITIRNIINKIRIERHRFMRLTLVRQQDKIEQVLKHFLVEDRGNDGSASYVDFLCHMHKEIRALLS